MYTWYFSTFSNSGSFYELKVSKATLEGSIAIFNGTIRVDLMTRKDSAEINITILMGKKCWGICILETVLASILPKINNNTPVFHTFVL